MLKKIDEREREIKDAMASEEHLRQEYDSRIEGIDADIETKEEEIEQFKKAKELLAKELEGKILEIWDALALPLDLFRVSSSPSWGRISEASLISEHGKAGRVTLQELVDTGLVSDGQILYFYHTRLFRDEQAEVIASLNKLRYKPDGKSYSISDLAKVLLTRHGFKRDEHGVAGPRYWRTEDGRLLNDLNEQVRAQRGDRR